MFHVKHIFYGIDDILCVSRETISEERQTVSRKGFIISPHSVHPAK